MKEKYITNFRASSQWLWSLLFILLAGLNQSFGQSDTCAGAPTLTSNPTCVTTTGSTTGAGDENNAEDCTIGTERSVWYQFQAVATSHTVTVVGAAGFDPVLQVANACGVAGNPTGGACIDNTGDGGTETCTVTGLTIGTFYKIQVHDWNGDRTANGFTICITHTPLPPTITSLATTSGCQGNSLVINGTNLTGATAVTIGGTAATITANTATTVTVTVGAGTTGTVQVTTPGGSATSAATYTVTPTPAAIGGGATTVCTAGTTPAFTNAVGGGTWSITNGTGTATIAGTGIVTGVTVGTATVVYTIGACSVSTPITVVTTPTVSTNPTNASVAPGGNTSFTVVATNTPTSYTWQVSTNGGGSWTTVTNGGVYSTATTATLNITGATLAMNGYMYRASATNACGTSAFSTNATLTVSMTYCAPTYTSGPGTIDGITNVTLLTLNNTTGANNVSPYYTFYNSVVIPNLIQGTSPTVSIRYGSDSNQWGAVWIDFNQNGTFEAAEGFVTTVNAGANGTSTLTIPVPGGAVLGNTRMRVRGGDDSALTTAQACGASSSGFGETEDYIVNIVAPVACATPTAQPTALTLTPSGTSIAGSFTAAVPAADNYLVVISTSATAPSPGPVNGVTYTVGGALGGGTVVDVDSNTSFNATGLSVGTTYYIYVYSYNSVCTGGPRYLTVSPLTGTTTTLSANYCTPTTSTTSNGLYISQVSIIGTLSDPGANNSTFAAPMGYQDFTGLPSRAIQAAGEGVNIVATSDGVTLVRGAWKAWVDWNKDGDFNDGGELVYNIFGFVGKNVTFGFVIPAGTTPGNYRIRVRVNNGVDTLMGTENYGLDFNSCQNFGTAGWNAYYGEAEDYLFTVIANCASKITSVTPGSTCGTGTVALSAVGTGATQYRWYDSEFGGSLLATTATGNWTTPSIATTTTYWVTSFNGTCESVARTAIKATVKKTSSLSFVTSNPEVCGENSIISLTASGNTEEVHLVNETFEAGGLGVFSTINNDANNATIDGLTQWANRTSTHVPNTNVFFPAISSGFGTNRFALTYSDALIPNRPTNPVINYLALTNSVNTTGFLNLNLRLKFYYSRYFDNGVNAAQEQVTIEVSTDGGTTYPTTLDTFTADTGIGSRFVTLNYALPAGLLNQANLKIRIRHYSNATATGWLPDGVAVDDIELYGDRPMSPNFTWSGASLPDAYTNVACTPAFAYVAGTPASTVWIKPTLAQLEMGVYSFTANANLSNGCTTSAPITITNKSKVWKGTIDNDWNKAGNWLPVGIPDINTCIVVPPAPNSNILSSGAAGLGKNLSVKTGGNLDIQGGNSLTIKETVNVDAGGIFNVQNNGSLIQIDNVANTVAGTFNYNRTANNIKGSDYVYWSSPVANQDISTTYTVPAQGQKFQWNTTAANANGGLGTWGAASGAMTTAKGYIVRGSSTYSMPATNINATFSGAPNNGDITIKATRGNMVPANVGPALTYTNPVLNAWDDNWNLLGNPYPSSINALQFLSTNSTELMGTVRLWRHLSDPAPIASPFYQTFVNNYNSSDYLTINYLASTSPTASDIIKTGQGFMVQRREGAQDLAGVDVVFNNTMRRDGTTVMSNSGFFKTGNSSPNRPADRHRIWVDIVDTVSQSSETAVVGYIDGATTGWDDNFDSTVGITQNIGIYSFADTQKCIIQGRPTPFTNDDIVPLGINVQNNGNYYVAIKAIDGLFSNNDQEIYLEDKLLNTKHDLKQSPYSFSSNAGTFNDRFELRFANKSMATSTFDTENAIKVFANESINVTSSNAAIKEVIVYDILGKTLASETEVNKNEVSLSSINKTQSTLLVKVTLTNGETLTKKVIF